MYQEGEAEEKKKDSIWRSQICPFRTARTSKKKVRNEGRASLYLQEMT